MTHTKKVSNQDNEYSEQETTVIKCSYTNLIKLEPSNNRSEEKGSGTHYRRDKFEGESSLADNRESIYRGEYCPYRPTKWVRDDFSMECMVNIRNKSDKVDDGTQGCEEEREMHICMNF